METTVLCPMCGANLDTDEKRCLSCGELLAQSRPKPTLLHAKVTPVGLLPSAMAGMFAGAFVSLILFVYERISRPKAAFELEGVAVAVSFCLIVGVALGLLVAVIRHARRNTHPDSSLP